MSNFRVIFIFNLLGWSLWAQTPLSVTQAWQQLEQRYPEGLTRELEGQMLQQQSKLNQKNLWPQVQVAGQATYQSAVTELPFSLPNMDVHPLAKDQYRVYAEVQQSLYDGGLNAAKQQGLNAQSQINLQRTASRVQQAKAQLLQWMGQAEFLYLQLVLGQKLTADYHQRLQVLRAGQMGGTVKKSQVALLEAEALKWTQKCTEWQLQRQLYLDQINQWLGQNFQAEKHFDLNPIQPPRNPLIEQRPEIVTLHAQQGLNQAQWQQWQSRLRPKLQAFVQGGYGQPALNMLSNAFTPYYIGGLRLQWDVSSLYSRTHQAQITRLQDRQLEAQIESQQWQWEAQHRQWQQQWALWEAQIPMDKALVDKRRQVSQWAAAELEAGVRTASDYIVDKEAEWQAETTLAQHRLQQQLAGWEWQLQLGESPVSPLKSKTHE